jgi:outer membrane lipoprotein-sorting protein
MFPEFRPFRRRFFALALAALASPVFADSPSNGLSADDQALVERARDYLRAISNAMGHFTQTDPRGHVTTGTFYLRRPGRARFEYDPPSGLVLASNGFRVAVLDKRLGTLDAYPLAATPLGVLLSRDIRLDKNVDISTVRRRPDGFSINAGRAGKRREGEIALEFSLSPLALTGWSITDAQGGVTRVALTDFAPSKAMPNAFFELAPSDAQPKSPES